MVNTLKVLADNRHISIVENVFKSFQNLYNKYYKQDFAIIESTYELSEDEISRIVFSEASHAWKVIVSAGKSPKIISEWEI